MSTIRATFLAVALALVALACSSSSPSEFVPSSGSAGDSRPTAEGTQAALDRLVASGVPGGVVMVTSRTPNDSLYYALAGTVDIQRIGDCLAPGTIATSVYSGHQCAQEMDAGRPADVRFRVERAPVPLPEPRTAP